jgi:hypothetical protein
MFHTYIVSVSSECCMCLQWLHICFQVFSGVCNCFRCMLQVFKPFWMYVASVSSRCYKSRYGVAHVAMGLPCRIHLLQLLGHCQAGADGLACIHVGSGGGTSSPICGHVTRAMSGRRGPSHERGHGTVRWIGI